MSPNTFFPQPSYERPPCSICGRTMMLARSEPDASDESDDDRRTFECVACNRSETLVIKYNGAATIVPKS
jgi:hypothetical protein